MDTPVTVGRALSDVVDRYVRGELCGDVDAQEFLADELGAGRKVHALLLLYAHDFPRHLMHEVLACTSADVDECLEAIGTHFPDARAAKRFLERAPSKEPSSVTSKRKEIIVTQGAKDALDMLEFWTSRWLDDQTSGDGVPGQHCSPTSTAAR